VGKKQRRAKRRRAVEEFLAAPPVPVTAESPRTPGFPIDFGDVVRLIKTLEGLRRSRVLAFYSEELEGAWAVDPVPALQEQLRAIGPRRRIDLWLHGTDFAPETAGRIVQGLRCYGQRLGLLVPELATGATTLLALGVDDVVLAPFAALPPIRPQGRMALRTATPDGERAGTEGLAPVSGRDIEHIMTLVHREAGNAGMTGPDFAATVTALFDKIHPLAIAMAERSRAASREVAERMLTNRMDPVKKVKYIKRVVEAVIDSAGPPRLPMGAAAARRLGLRVPDPGAPLIEAMCALVGPYRDRGKAGAPVRTVLPSRPVARMDSAEMSLAWVGTPGDAAPPTRGGWVRIR